MIYANYHTHTKRCHHADGEDREYVEAAIEAGIKELGFSDHAPMIFSDPDYYSGFRMRPEDAEGYVNSISALREEYKNDIKIRIGFELEYYPAYFEKTIDFLHAFDYEYLLLGQHFAGDEPYADYSGHPLDDENTLKKYVDLVLDGMETGEFLYVAHPDIINFTGNNKIYRREMKRICDYAKRTGMPIEYNELGHEGHRNYPNGDFLRLCGEVGNTLIIGVDAHTPSAFHSEELKYVCEHLPELDGITVTDKIDPSKFRTTRGIK